MSTLDIIFFDAGGGHRATANAIQSQLLPSSEWKVNLINLRDVLDAADPIKKWFGFNVEDFYNGYIKSGYTYGSGVMLRALQQTIKIFNGKISDAVSKFYSSRKPDMVISVIPNFNKALFDGIKSVKNIPYVTIMCDMSDCPPHFWMEDQDQYMIVGTKKALHQALDCGYYRHTKIGYLDGMIVNPKFYTKHHGDYEHPTGIVSYGAAGSSNIIDIAKMIDKSKYGCMYYMIYICGHNEKVKKELTQLKLNHKATVLGFTSELPDLMDGADFFIGKPGPGSINEALVKHLPVLVEDNHYQTMIQERYNVEWLIGMKFGDKIKLGDVTKFDDFITNLNQYRINVMSYANMAIYKLPPILEEILKKEKQDEVITGY